MSPLAQRELDAAFKENNELGAQEGSEKEEEDAVLK